MQKNTIYTHDYPGYNAEQIKDAMNMDLGADQFASGPDARTGKKAKISGITIFKQDYPGHDPQAPEKVRQRPQLPVADFPKHTTYGDNYIEHDLKNAAPADFGDLPVAETTSYRRPQIPITGETAYNTTYKGHKIEPVVGEDVNGIFTGSIMSKLVRGIGNTSYADEFKGKIPRFNKEFTAQEFQGPEGRHRSKMNGVTTFTDDYTEKPLPEKHAVKKRRKGPKRKVDGKTTYNQDYLGEKDDKLNNLNRDNNLPDPSLNDRSRRNRPGFKGDTNYHDDYQGRQNDKADPLAPLKQPAKGKFDPNTTYGVNYKGEKGDLNQDVDLGDIPNDYEGYRRPKINMDLATTFKESYPGHQPNPAEPVKRRTPLPKGKVEDRTSYNTEFIPHDLREAQGIIPEDDGYNTDGDGNGGKRSKAKFQGETQYMGAYKGEAPIPQEKLADLPTLPKGKMDTRTTTGQAYQGKQNPLNHDELQGDEAMFYKQSGKSRPKFKGETTFAHDYTGHEITPQNPGPAFKYKKNPAKLGKSSYNTDYIGEDPDFVRELNAYGEGPNDLAGAGERRKVKFDGTTNYNDEFVGKELPQVHAEGQAPNPKADFKGQSTYDHDFHNFKGVDYTKYGAPEQDLDLLNIQNSNKARRAKMKGHTNYQDDYIGHEIPKTEPVKRRTQAPAGKMSNKTSYNTEYIGYEGEGNPNADPYFDQFTTGQTQKGGRKIPFRGETTYKHAYLGDQLGAQDAQEPLPQLPKGKFHGKTIYGKDYQGKNGDLAKVLNNDNIANDGYNLGKDGQTPKGRNKVKFHGQTNYQSDYVEKNLGPKKKSKKRRKGPKAKFDGRTIQNTDYTSKELGKYTQAEAAPSSRRGDGPSSSRRHRIQFKGITSYTDAYRGKANEKGGDLPSLPEAHKGKFHSKTTYGTFHDSKLIPAARELNRQAETEVIITERIVTKDGKVITETKTKTTSNGKTSSRRKPKMDLRTSYNNDYIKPKGGKNAWEIRKLQNQLGKAKFNGRTTYNTEFIQREKINYESDNGQILVEYSSGARDRVRPKFRGTTTYNAGYCGGI